MVITLGSEGEQLQVIIPVDADFVSTLSATDVWPAGTAIELHLSNSFTDTPVIWSATVSGTTAVFNESKTAIQPVVEARLSLARLFYSPDGLSTLLWAYGTTRFV